MENVNPWEVFGMEEPAAQQEEPGQEAPASENKQEAAAPAGTGENEQRAADSDTDGQEEPGQEEPGQENQPEDQIQTKEERAKQARLRRQQEQDQAVQAAVNAETKKFQDRLGAFFKAAKIKNPYAEGAEITSLEEAEAWAERDKTEKLNKRLKAGSLTREDLQTALEDSPKVQQLQERLDQAERAAQATQSAAFEHNVEVELAEIAKLNPKIKSLTDIIQMPTGKDFARLVQNNGLDYLSAYKLANHDQLMEQEQRVAAAGARAAAGGTEHLHRTSGRGTGAVEVPADVRASYRVLMPDKSDAEIQKMYQREINNQ